MQINDYALVIGLNHYPDYRSLSGPIPDAENFYKWVSDKKGGGVPEENRRLILSSVGSDPDDIPTPVQPEIDRAITKFIKRLQENPEQPARRFYFYFAGHGLGLNPNQIGLCLPTWSEDDRWAALLSNEYLNVIQDYGVFKEIFFFLDCCRVSEISVGGLPPTFRSIISGERTGNTEYCVALAAEFQSKAFEDVVQTGGNAPEIRGFFTTALLEALNNTISLNQLEHFVKKRTLELAKAKGLEQMPRFQIDFSQETSAVILGNAKAKAPDTSFEFGFIGHDAIFELEVLYPQETEVSVFDANSRLVYPKGFDGFSIGLPPGEYTIMMQRGDRIEVQKVNHARAKTTFKIPSLSTYTPVLLANAESSHEYYTDHAIRCSTHVTNSSGPIGGSSESGFFLFARYLGKEQVPQGGSPFPKFSLLDENMNTAKDFNDTCIEKDAKTGWFSFSTLAKKGQYYLQFENEGTSKRVVPVYFFPGWQTQVFVALSDGNVVFNSVRLLMSRPDVGFNPRDAETHKADFAYKCLQNPQVPMPPYLLEWLLDGKFQNPIYGMLGVYLMEQRDKEALSYYGRKPEEVLPIVAQNLLGMTQSPESPDIRAILLLAKQLSEKPNFEHPPMFDFGADKIIEYDAESRASIPAGSFFDKIAGKRIADLALVCWEAQSSLAPWILNSLATEILKANENKTELHLSKLAGAFRLPKATVEEAAKILISKTNAEDIATKNFSDKADVIRIGAERLLNPTPPLMEKLKVFILNAQVEEDQKIRKELTTTCLKRLKDAGLISYWDKTQILPGQITNQELEKHFIEADIVIGLLSSDYFAEDYSQTYHQKTLDHNKKAVYILGKACFYELNPEITQNLPIPRNESNVPKAIEEWPNKNNAYIQIAKTLHETIKEIKKG